MDQLASSFLYEQCDVPAGVSLSEWRQAQAPRSPRRVQVAGGVMAAVATLAPVLMSLRGIRPN
jgi:hypothetical protein